MDIVIFSSIVWDDQGGAHRPTQIARALARQGHHILFVQVGLGAPRAVTPNIQITSLGALGLSESELRRAWFGFNTGTANLLVRNFSAALATFERSNSRCAIWMIPFSPFVGLWQTLCARGYRTVYDCLDDFTDAGQLGHYFANPHAEKFLARNVDLLTVVTPALAQKFGALAPSTRIEIVPNGVALDFYARGPAPRDLLRGELTLGFWGHLADYTVDLPALEQVAQQRPTWTLNLIGQTSTDVTRLRALGNVRLLGRRAHDELMDYVTGFDVCLIPFPSNDFSRGRDPIKLYEYLAAHKPVVALHTPQLSVVPGVWVANSAAQFVTQIKAAAAAPFDRARVDPFLRASSWEARAEKLMALISSTPPRAPREHNEFPSDGFEDPSTLVERTLALLAHLERTADERLGYIRDLEQHARATDVYLKKLERTHPLMWLKRIRDRWREHR